MLLHGQELQVRFNNAKPVAGIRDKYCFIPVSETQLKFSRVSGDTDSFIASVAYRSKLSSKMSLRLIYLSYFFDKSTCGLYL